MSKFPNPSEATTEYLREQLITADFRGQDYKRRCLEELLEREREIASYRYECS